MAKKRYDRPLIKRHTVGLSPKGGAPTFVKVIREIDGVAIPDLLAEYGSPLFVMSENRLRTAWHGLDKVLRPYFPKIVQAWSYKTNWLRAVCAVFHQEGAWAEVVSDVEYAKARALGMTGDKIIFNGPLKSRAALEAAFRDGAMVNLDSLDEMLLAEEATAGIEGRPRVGLRVNMTAGSYPVWHRFGFNFESGEAMMAARRLVRGGRLDLTGLHCHIGTFVLDPFCYYEQARKLAGLAQELREELGLEVEYLNLGGGFASRNTLLHQYLPGDTASPSFEEYASAMAEGFKAAKMDRAVLPHIVLETGRALVDEAGYLLTRVGAVKRLPSGVRAVVVDAGVNLLVTAHWYRHEIMPAQSYEGDLELTAVYGPLCMNIDVLRESVNLPALKPGDPLVIWPVGAYNMTQWLQFIQLRPRVVMVGPEGRTDLIRTADELSDVLDHEPLPDRLAGRAASPEGGGHD